MSFFLFYRQVSFDVEKAQKFERSFRNGSTFAQARFIKPAYQQSRWARPFASFRTVEEHESILNSSQDTGEEGPSGGMNLVRKSLLTHLL